MERDGEGWVMMNLYYNEMNQYVYKRCGDELCHVPPSHNAHTHTRTHTHTGILNQNAPPPQTPQLAPPPLLLTLSLPLTLSASSTPLDLASFIGAT